MTDAEAAKLRVEALFEDIFGQIRFRKLFIVASKKQPAKFAAVIDPMIQYMPGDLRHPETNDLARRTFIAHDPIYFLLTKKLNPSVLEIKKAAFL